MSGCQTPDVRHAGRRSQTRGSFSAVHHPQGVDRPTVATPISSTRQRQILALLLGAFSILALASIATYQPPLPFAPPWAAPNACGPVGATLAFALVWAIGHVAAFGVPLLTGAWSWNRLRDRPMGPLLLRSMLSALMAFEVCTLLGLGGLARQTWSGSWGFATSLALRSALGDLGGWIVAGALLGVTVLAASELGFRWLGPLLRGTLFTPVIRLVQAWRGWRERQAAAVGAAARAAGKSAKKPRVARAPGGAASETGALADEPVKSRPRIMAAASGLDAGLAGALKEDQLTLPHMPEPTSAPRPRPKPALTAARTNGHPAPPVGPVPAEALPALTLLDRKSVV